MARYYQYSCSLHEEKTFNAATVAEAQRIARSHVAGHSGGQIVYKGIVVIDTGGTGIVESNRAPSAAPASVGSRSIQEQESDRQLSGERYVAQGESIYNAQQSAQAPLAGDGRGGYTPNPSGQSSQPSLPPAPDSFSEELYLKANPDVKKSWKASGWSHYLAHGKAEGRKGDFTPSGWSEKKYLEANPDVKQGWKGSGLSHYLAHGKNENRRSDFSAGSYISKSEGNAINNSGLPSSVRKEIRDWHAQKDANHDGKVTKNEMGQGAIDIHEKFGTLGGGDNTVSVQDNINYHKSKLKKDPADTKTPNPSNPGPTVAGSQTSIPEAIPTASTTSPQPDDDTVDLPGSTIQPGSSEGSVAGVSDAVEVDASNGSSSDGQMDENTDAANEAATQAEEERKEKEALAAQQSQKDKEREDALAQSALSQRRTADEDRMKKIMRQRQAWGGASASAGAEGSLAAPVVTPASAARGIGGIPGGR